MDDAALVWFRRDLRMTDHPALFHALKNARRVWCVFVFDRAILDPLLAAGQRADRRVEFIQRSLVELDRRLRAAGGGLIVRHADARDAIPDEAARRGAAAVYAADDYEPAAIARDAAVAATLAAAGRTLHRCKDHVIFEKDEIVTGAGRPFGVFTPYKNAWLRRLTPFYYRAYPVERYLGALAPAPADAAVPPLETLGFAPTNLAQLPVLPGESGAHALLQDFLGRIEGYDRARDFPATKGPSYLSVHLRFGTLSIRAAVRAALQMPPGMAQGTAGAAAGADSGADSGAGPPGPGRATWLSELIWRDFYQMILYQHPEVVDHAFRPAYDRITWQDDPAAFDAWREGRTGYPLVDAAMAQINRTGYMHNRLRMVVASFLVKDLGIDWRRGERWFAQALIDYDLAANNGGWQWAASTGCDAQPYFRIFNPVTQSQRFDPDGRFIRRYLPALAGLSAQEIHAPWLVPALRQQAAGCVIGRDYPAPIVDHAEARARTLARFAAARDGGT